MRVLIFVLLGFTLLSACRNEREPTVSDADSVGDSVGSKEINLPPYNVEINEKTGQLRIKQESCGLSINFH